MSLTDCLHGEPNLGRDCVLCQRIEAAKSETPKAPRDVWIEFYSEGDPMVWRSQKDTVDATHYVDAEAYAALARENASHIAQLEEMYGKSRTAAQERDDALAKLNEAKVALEFYADKNGENWAACRPNDTHETCCHMIGESSGGHIARECLERLK